MCLKLLKRKKQGGAAKQAIIALTFPFIWCVVLLSLPLAGSHSFQTKSQFSPSEIYDRFSPRACISKRAVIGEHAEKWCLHERCCCGPAFWPTRGCLLCWLAAPRGAPSTSVLGWRCILIETPPSPIYIQACFNLAEAEQLKAHKR